jgi:hypothetical protein
MALRLSPLASRSQILTLGLTVAVLSGRHPRQDPFAGRNPEAAAGDMLPIHDPGHFAIGSDLFLVIAAAVLGDFEARFRRRSLLGGCTPRLCLLRAVTPCFSRHLGPGPRI